MAARARSSSRQDTAAEAVAAGWSLAASHPMFIYTASALTIRRGQSDLPPDGWARVDSANGVVDVHPTRLADSSEWAWVFAHLMLHLGFGHVQPETAFADLAGSTASDVTVDRFQQSMRFGRSPLPSPASWPTGREDSLAESWRVGTVPRDLIGMGVGGSGHCVHRGAPNRWRGEIDWERKFALGLTNAVAAAVDVAGGARESLLDPAAPLKPWELARKWFLSAYPLLGATMSTLIVVADAELARGWDIPIAAVDPVAGELYVNPLAQYSEREWRFILAHEALHAALAHHTRAGGRDAYLFNLATDFVINGWLVEMGVGEMPEGLLYDAQFAGQSSEEVYDQIAIDARRYRKLATLRGRDKPDILANGGRTSSAGAGVDLDELLRRSLGTGLDLHASRGRGTLPAALVSEIRALSQPPLRWDVELARWFEEMFPALEPTQTYARPSRRQSETPDIPRPGWLSPDVPVDVRTFGVVLDTSLSMSTTLLGKALGAISSYARAHDVPAVRVVYCDAIAYDAGYIDVDEIAGRVKVRGRGGTVLQPGVDLLERAADFPANGPMLIITDGQCDVLRVRRSHAFLTPAGATLPFRPKGPVFRFE